MIYLFLTEGFEELEALAPLDLLRRAGVEVLTVAVNTQGKRAMGAHGVAVEADAAESDIDLSVCGGVILPGGPGHAALERSSVVLAAIELCAQTGQLLAAICAAPGILGRLGYLQGRRAVCYPGYEQDLRGAVVLQSPVARDGNLVTARGAGCSVAFALALVGYLVSPEKADEIAAKIQCP